MRGGSGYSIVEVLVAVQVLLVGLVPASAAISHSIRSGLRGRARATAALAMLSRADRLRSLAQQTVPPCAALADGAAAAVGYSERWTVSGGDTLKTVRLTVTVPLPRLPLVDSARVRFRCL
jgi:Tfp pilus assembly protein PilV